MGKNGKSPRPHGRARLMAMAIFIILYRGVSCLGPLRLPQFWKMGGVIHREVGEFRGNVGLFARNGAPVHWTVAMFAMIWWSWSIFHGGWMGKLFLSSRFNLFCLYRSINLVDIAQSRRNHENVMAVLAAQDLQDLHNQIELTISSIIPALST